MWITHRRCVPPLVRSQFLNRHLFAEFLRFLDCVIAIQKSQEPQELIPTSPTYKQLQSTSVQSQSVTMSAAIPGFTSSDRHPPRVRGRLFGHRLARSWGRKTGPTPGPGTRCVLSRAGRHPARPPTPGAKHRSLGRGTPPNAPPQQVGGCGGWGPRPTPRTRLPGPKASVSQRVAGTRGHGGLPPAFPPRVPGRAQSTLLVSLCELLDQLFVAIGAVMHGTSAIDVIHVDHAIVPTCAQVEVARMSGCSRSCGTGTKGQLTQPILRNRNERTADTHPTETRTDVRGFDFF